MGYELAEQLGWTLPDAIVYPTGGGTGIVGFWKAFEEMEQLGWTDGKRPRMYSVQPEGCAPIVRAFHQGKRFAEPWQDAHTLAAGMRVPAAIGDYLMLDALRESGGGAVSPSPTRRSSHGSRRYPPSRASSSAPKAQPQPQPCPSSSTTTPSPPTRPSSS